MSYSLMMSSALVLVSIVSCFTIFMYGFSAWSFSAAESILGRPTSLVLWMICRWRLLSSTLSKSTKPRVPMPAAEIVGKRRAKSASADAEHLCGLQLLLAFQPDLRQKQVPRIAGDFFIGKLWLGHGFFCQCWHSNLKPALKALFPILFPTPTSLRGVGYPGATAVYRPCGWQPPAIEGMMESESSSFTWVASFSGR